MQNELAFLAMMNHSSPMKTQPYSQFKFPLDSNDCELLSAFDQAKNLVHLSKMLDRDPSVLSRQLKKIHEKSNLLEKHQGRWKLSPQGKKLVAWVHESISSQGLILNEYPEIKIATTREFAVQFLAPKLEEVQLPGQPCLITVVSCENGVEEAILNSRADIGIDCGIPFESSIKFHRVAREPIAVLATPKFFSNYQINSIEDLIQAPHLHFQRINSTRYLNLPFNVKNIRAVFNDIAAAKAACCAGHGWAILPQYAVAGELKTKKLQVFKEAKVPDEFFGVWWLRERANLKPWVQHLIQWLKKQDLD